MEGGNHVSIGRSGERGTLQFLDSTWKIWSKEVTGRILPFNQDNEWYVALRMVEKWLEQGLNEKEIALMWNQGSTGPCRVGRNKHGVDYNSCAYSQRVVAIVNK